MRLARVGPPGSEQPVVATSDGTLLSLSAVTPDVDAAFLAALLTEGPGEVPVGDLPVLADGAPRFGPPVARPGKIVGIGLNYAAHAAEAGLEPPEEPVVFLKAPTSICGPQDDIRMLPGSQRTDYEVELGVVLGATLRDERDPGRAMAAVAGYVLAQDVSDRALQLERGGTWTKGKSADTFCPVGPWLVTPDEVGDPARLRLRLQVNDVARQDGPTSDMIFDVAQLLCYVSRLMTLEPGDLMVTGTPAGVAMGQPHPRPYLRHGDLVEADGGVLGSHRNRVVDPGKVAQMNPDIVFRAGRAVVDGAETAATVVVTDGRVSAIAALEAPLDAVVEDPARATVVELADDEVLLPGLVDAHVHVNEPGRTDWEGFASATRAAAAGGVTTIIDMPLNSIPPTVTVAALREKQKVARDQAFVDVGFWGGAVPGNLADLRPLHDAGVFGFKCFLLHSGVDEFPHLSPAELHDALTEVATFDGLVIVHAEDAETIDTAPPPAGPEYAGFLGSRPKEAEERAIALVAQAARQTGARAHILHLSDADALPLITQAQAEGVRLSVETCPHYLTLEAEQIPDGATQFKCCPPIREHANRDRLWAGLTAGTIRTIVSDHSPCTADLKRFDSGDFGEAWGGIAGLQLGLPAVWTEARQRGHGVADVVRWMAQGPADQVGLADRGRIAVGAAADLVVFAPDQPFTVEVAALHHKNPVSAYAGRTLTGVVRQTWLHGIPVDLDAAPRGRLLERGQS